MDSIMGALGDGVDPPKAMLGVKQAVSGGDPLEIGAALYLLLTEQALDYDIEDGKMQPTKVDFSNTEDMKVKEKMAYCYTYGINMFKRGFISEDALKDAVLNKVASRVGMDGPAFDKWLAIPAVET